MAVPYDLYLRFLATKNVVDRGDVNQRLEELNLPPIAQAAIDTQFALIARTLPRGVAAQLESGNYSVDWMRHMRVLEVDRLWYGEKQFLDPDRRSVARLAADIHQDPQVRTPINALLIKNIPPPDIVNALRMRYATLLKDEHVALYRDFFFNPARMTRADWKTYLAQVSTTEQHIYFMALTDSVDVVKTELELPAKVDVSSMLQVLLAKTYAKAKTYLSLSTKESNEEARRFVSLTMDLADKYEKYRSGDTTDFGNALQMEFEYVESEFPTPDGDTLAQLQAELKEKEEKAKSRAASGTV